MNEWEFREMENEALGRLDYVGALKWADLKGLKLLKVLGMGTSGIAVLLDGGRVLKITFNENEVDCVHYLMSNFIEIPHLPKFYDYGYELKFYYIIREEIPNLPRSLIKALPPSPQFLLDRDYIREQTPEVIDFYNQVEEAIHSFDATDMHFHDIDWLDNWGKRADGTYVFRDVACWSFDSAKAWLENAYPDSESISRTIIESFGRNLELWAENEMRKAEDNGVNLTIKDLIKEGRRAIIDSGL